MKKSIRRLSGAWLVLAAVMAGCGGGVEKAPFDEAATARVPTGRTPETLAILPFENNSVSDAQRYEPLSKGLAAMLITDLNKQESALKLIERDKIAALLQEIALGQSGVVDQATALRAGRILGAQSIAFGSFMVLAEQVRIDLRIVNVETSELILADSIIGASDAFIALEGRLAAKIARSLRIAFKPEAPGAAGSMDAALLFSLGVAALDRGETAEADRLFAQCVDLDPAYRYQVDSVKGANR
jgi:TolB-like protein